MIKAFLLDVQKTEEERMAGNLHDLLLDEKCSFVGLDEAVFLMDEAMDLKEDRAKIREKWCYMPMNMKDSSRFYIRILFREQNTWQGEVTTIRTGRKEYFRNVMELLRIVSGNN